MGKKSGGGVKKTSVVTPTRKPTTPIPTTTSASVSTPTLTPIPTPTTTPTFTRTPTPTATPTATPTDAHATEAVTKAEEGDYVSNEKTAEDQAAREEQHREAMEKHTRLIAIRERNLRICGDRPGVGMLGKLDSSLKKNTAYVRKLRAITEENRASLVKEFDGLNLSKYVSECVSSICEGKLKNNDMSAVVEICGLFHCRYADFAGLMSQRLSKILADPSAQINGTESVTTVAARCRATLRLFAELIVDGILLNTVEFLNCFKDIVVADKEKHQLLTVVVSLIRHMGEVMLGIIARKQREYREANNIEVIPRLNIFKTDEEKKLLYYCEGYYSTLSRRLIRDHKEINQWETTNEHIIMDKGELSTSRQEAYDEKLKAYEKLAAGTSTLADLLDQDYPDLPKREALDRTMNVGISVGGRAYMEGKEGEGQLWEDDDTRAFYEDLVQLRDVVPAVLLGELATVDESERKSVSTSSEGDASTTGKKEGDRNNLDTAVISSSPRKESAETIGENVVVDLDIVVGVDDDEPALGVQEREDENMVSEDVSEGVNEVYKADVSDDEADDEGTGTTSAAMKLKLESLFERLPNTMNREAVDKLAVELCYVNNKATRKRLGRFLATSDVNRFDLIPYYSRLIASLSPVMPDLVGYVIEPLEKEFRWQQARNKKQVNLDYRVRVIRYFAELTKFGVYKKQNALNILQKLVAEFVGFNIDLACGFLEHCGIYLFRSAESHARTAKLLEVMMRKRVAQRMDPQHVSAIENSFYICNPPPNKRKVRKERPPMHTYIRMLLFSKLSKSTCSYVIKQMRKLPWNDPTIKAYAIKCLSKPWNCKHGVVRHLAAVVEELDVYQEGLGMRVVDAIVEHIRLGLEVNRLDWNRQRLATIHYFGELYVYKLVSTRLLQDTLYTCLLFGHDLYTSPNMPSVSLLDPPNDYFRIRLVCTLLDVVGLYLTGTSTKKKTDFFLMFLQRYALGKTQPLPVEVDMLIQDLFDSLAPKTKLFTTWEQANDAILVLQKKLVGDALEKQEQEYEKKLIEAKEQQLLEEKDAKVNAIARATVSDAKAVPEIAIKGVVPSKENYRNGGELGNVNPDIDMMDLHLDHLGLGGGSEGESEKCEGEGDSESDDENECEGGDGTTKEDDESEGESEGESETLKEGDTDDESEGDGEGEDSEDDNDDEEFNTVKLIRAPKPHEPDEFDIMFMDEFSKFVQDQSVARRNEAKTSVLDIPIPMSVKKVTLVKSEQLYGSQSLNTQAEDSTTLGVRGEGDETDSQQGHIQAQAQTVQPPQSHLHSSSQSIDYGAAGMVRREKGKYANGNANESISKPGGSGNGGIKFALMTRKGNKPQLRDIDVPMDSVFAQNIRRKQEEELAEQRELKKFVLDFEVRAEEMEQQETLQEQRAANWRAAHHGRKPPTMENRQAEKEDITSKFTTIQMGPRRHPDPNNSKRGNR
eukprot:CFRG4242T1